MSKYPKDIVNCVEDLRNRTTENIQSIQSGLIPEFVNTQWSKIDHYTYDGKKVYNLAKEDLTYFKIDNVRYKQYSGIKSNMRFIENAYDAVVTKGLINPFVFFINGQAIRLSEIEVVRELKYSYFIVHRTERFGEITDVQMIHIPFKVNYSETREFEDQKVIFQFNEDGLTAPHGHVVYATTLDTMMLVEDSYLSGATVNKLVIDELEPTYKLSENNFIFFKNRKLIRDMPIHIYNLNVITLNDGNPIDGDLEFILFYRNVINENISNVTIPYNTEYVRSMITDETDPENLDITTFEQDFNFKYDKNISYDQNLTNAIQYLHVYRQFLVNPIYEKRSIIRTLQYTGKEIRQKLDSKGNLRMLRWKYKKLDTFVMVFRNNLLHERYKDLHYEANSWTLPLVSETLEDDDIFEIVFFRFVNNFNCEYTMPEDENWITHIPLDIDELQIASPWIPDQFYGLEPRDNTRYNIDFTAERDENDPSIIHIYFKDKAYYEVPSDMPDRTEYKITIYTDNHSDIYINDKLVEEDYVILKRESPVKLNIIPHDGYFVDSVELNQNPITPQYDFVLLDNYSLEVRTDTVTKQLQLIIPQYGKITVNGTEYTTSTVVDIDTDSTVNVEFGTNHWDWYVSNAYFDGVSVNPNSYQFIMDENHTLQVEVLKSIETFSVTVDASTHCAVTLNGSLVTTGNYPYLEDTEIEINATPHTHYIIKSVTLDGQDITNQLPYKFLVATNHVLTVETESTLRLKYHLDPMMKMTLSFDGVEQNFQSGDDPINAELEVDFNSIARVESVGAVLPTYSVRHVWFNNDLDILNTLPYQFTISENTDEIYVKGAKLVAVIVNYEEEQVTPTINGEPIHRASNYYDEWTEITLNATANSGYYIISNDVSINSEAYQQIDLPYTFRLTSATTWNINTGTTAPSGYKLNYFGNDGDNERVKVTVDGEEILPNTTTTIPFETAQYTLEVVPLRGYQVLRVTIDDIITDIDLRIYTNGRYTTTLANDKNHNISLEYIEADWVTWYLDIQDVTLHDDNAFIAYGAGYYEVFYLVGTRTTFTATEIPENKRAVIYEDDNASRYVSLPTTFTIGEGDKHYTIKAIDIGTDYEYQAAYIISEEPHYTDATVSLITMGVTNQIAPSDEDNPQYAVGLSTFSNAQLRVESTNANRYIEYIVLNDEITFYSDQEVQTVTLTISPGTYNVKVGLFNPNDCKFLYNISGVSVYINGLLFAPGMYTLHHTSDDAPIQYVAYQNAKADIYIVDPNDASDLNPDDPRIYSESLPFAFHDVTDYDPDDEVPIKDVTVQITPGDTVDSYNVYYSPLFDNSEDDVTLMVNGTVLHIRGDIDIPTTVSEYNIVVTPASGKMIADVYINSSKENKTIHVNSTSVFTHTLQNNDDYTIAISLNDAEPEMYSISVQNTDNSQIKIHVNDQIVPNNSSIELPKGSSVTIYAEAVDPDMQQYVVLDVSEDATSNTRMLSAAINTNKPIARMSSAPMKKSISNRTLDGKCGLYITNIDTSNVLGEAFVVNGELFEKGTTYDPGTVITIDIADEVSDYLELFMRKDKVVRLPYTFVIEDDTVFVAIFDNSKPIPIDLYNTLTGYNLRIEDVPTEATLTFIPQDDTTITMNGEPVVGPKDVIRDELYKIAGTRNDTGEFIKLAIETTPIYSEYLGKTIGLYSKRQFRYCFYNVQENKCMFTMTSDFKYCLDINRYMVFINGRMLTDNMYRILIETKDNAFLEPCIHTRVMCQPGDRFEAFYLPMDCVSMDISDAHKTTISKVTATADDQPMFTIPFPFDNYLDNAKNSFILILGSVIVDPQRYNVIGNRLVFINEEDYVAKGRELTFIFFYSESSSLDDLAFVKEEDHIIVDVRYTQAGNVEPPVDPPEEPDEMYSISVQNTDNSQIRILVNNSEVANNNSVKLPKGSKVDIYAEAIDPKMQQYVVLDVSEDTRNNTRMLSAAIDMNKTAKKSISNITLDDTYGITNIDTAKNGPQKTFTIPWPDDPRYIRGVHPMFVTLRSLYINPDRYTIDLDSNTLTFKYDQDAQSITAGTALVFTFMYPQNDHEIISSTVPVTATSNGQLEFAIPLPYENYFKDYNNIMVTLQGTYLTEKEDYTIDRDTNTLMLNDYRGLNIGEQLLFMFSYGVNLTIRSKSVNLTVTHENQFRFKLPEVFDGYNNAANKFFLVINTVFIDPRRYSVADGYLILEDNDFNIQPIGTTIQFIIVYTQDTTYIPASNLDASASNRYTTIESLAVPIEYDGQKTFTLPKENALLLNKQFFITIGSTFIHELLYTTNVLDNTITFTDEMTEGLDAGREVLFSFIDNDYLVIEHETSETYATADGQTVFDIELPFTNYLELGNQVLVFRNRTFMDPERYTIDDTTNTITLLDMNDGLDEGEALFFMFVYVANQQNESYDREDVSSVKIQEYGYIYLTKSNMKYAADKKLYFLFINGKKIDLNSIEDIAANIIRLNRDVQTRYNVAIFDYTPQIPEFKEFNRILSEYDQILNKVKYDQLNRLFNIYTRISDTEPRFIADISQESMIQDIVLYHYISQGISEGLPFVYTYDHGALTLKDEYGNYIIGSLNADTEDKTNFEHFINE